MSASSESRVSAVTDAEVEAATNAGLGAQISGPHLADPVCSKGPGEPISGTCYLHVDQMRFLARVMLEAAAKVKQPVCLSVRSKVPAPVSASSSRAEGHTSTAPPLPSDKAVTSFALDRVKLDAENNAELARCLEERYGDRNGCCCSWDFARGYAAAIRFVRVHTEPGEQPSAAAAVAAFDAYLEAYEVPPHVMPRVPNAQDLAKMRAALSAAYAVDAPNARPAVLPTSRSSYDSDCCRLAYDAGYDDAQRPAVSGDAAEVDALVAELREWADYVAPNTGEGACDSLLRKAADCIEDLQRRLAASEKRVAELSAIEERRSARKFPILHGAPPSIPWAMIAPYDYYAQQNCGGQNLEKLASRGGLSAEEAVAVLEKRRYSECPDATEKLLARVKAFHATGLTDAG